MLGDALDRAVLAGGVASFEDDEQFPALGDDMALQLDQLNLQMMQFFIVFIRHRNSIDRVQAAVNQGAPLTPFTVTFALRHPPCETAIPETSCGT